MGDAGLGAGRDADPRLCLQVDWLQQQEVKRRVKRQVRGEPHTLPFNDPVWPNMWYLVGISPTPPCEEPAALQGD